METSTIIKVMFFSLLANQSHFYNMNVTLLLMKNCYRMKEDILIGDKNFWFSVSNHYFTSHDDDGYRLYYFYCGDFSSYLDYPWLPFLVWTLLNVLPSILLAILSNIQNLFIIIKYPGSLFAPLTSYFVVCPRR